MNLGSYYSFEDLPPHYWHKNRGRSRSQQEPKFEEGFQCLVDSFASLRSLEYELEQAQQGMVVQVQHRVESNSA